MQMFKWEMSDGDGFMSIKCLFGFHSWDGCKCSKCGQTRDKKHQWEGLKCSRCGQGWDEELKRRGLKCPRCGQTRDEEHPWINCKCTRCGKVVHRWDGGCTCKECGLVRAEKGHKWKDGVCSICGKEEVFTANFEELAEKAYQSQQTILIKLKDANHLLTAVREMLSKTQNLEFGEAYDKAKQMIHLECPNCGELTNEAKNSVYFFAEGGAVETFGGNITLGTNIASVSKRSCPGCHGTVLRAVINIVK